ncbi:9818_t:CDS:2 [Funneliformis geosporum]|uniref:9818_t:CDS:1 n=1 Tax=Funneliformis geosporum TaxID=1117311 RepID=A0A9W4WW46_9GLOM|nr:9818_t:CDS:2 [Funneliformis geosporum]
MVKSRKKKITGKFTNAENLKDMFFMNAENRRKAGDKAYEDCESLAQFFNSINSIADDVGEIKLSANEQIFNQRKQLLINKIQDCINKCQASDSYSIASVCCIQKLEPKHQKELLDLESQARTAESAYKENLQKANSETDPTKKAEFIVLANKASQNAERIKQKIKTNPLMEVGNFSYLDDLKKLTKGNVPRQTSSSSRNPRNTNSNNSNNSQQLVNQQQIYLFAEIKQKLGETTEQLENKVKEFSPYYTNLEPYQRGLILIALTQSVKKTDKKKLQKQVLLMVLLVGLGYYFFIYLPEEEKKSKKQQNTDDRTEEELKIEQEENA